MSHPAKVRLTEDNIDCFPSFKRLLDDGKIVVDATGRLRYPHGAPVGELILTRILEDGTPRYKESATEWFDPESPKAKSFVWPS